MSDISTRHIIAALRDLEFLGIVTVSQLTTAAAIVEGSSSCLDITGKTMGFGAFERHMTLV
jgi:hypothetical protein